MKQVCFVLLTLSQVSCQSSKSFSNKYEAASSEQTLVFKKVALPLLPKTQFKISQGAFGQYSHSEPGNEYSWDFDVPYGTSVVAVESGKVLSLWQPNQEGGCDPKHSNFAHNIKIEHSDGTVSQYVHIQTNMKEGDQILKGQVIAKTAKNGWICNLQLHFSIYASKQDLYGSPSRKTIPLLFEGLPNPGLAIEGYESKD